MRKLAPSLVHIATRLGIYWDRTRKREYNLGMVGPSGPRSEYGMTVFAIGKNPN